MHPKVFYHDAIELGRRIHYYGLMQDCLLLLTVVWN